MSKLRNIMYPGSSGSVLNVNKNSPGNGNGKWQGLPPNVGIRSGLIPYINTRARGDRRNHIFCINQLGGVGPKSNMFVTTADGVQDCEHGEVDETTLTLLPHPRIIPTVLIPKLVQLYCGSNDETLINMPPIYDDPTPPFPSWIFAISNQWLGIRNWFRLAQQIHGYGPQNGQFVICTSSDTKSGIIKPGESAFENMPAQLKKRMPNEDISKHFFSADKVVGNLKWHVIDYTIIKKYLSYDKLFSDVHQGTPPFAYLFNAPQSAIRLLWWSFYTHWDPAKRGYPISGFTPGIDQTGFKLCWISNEALKALTCSLYTPILPVYQNPSRIEICPGPSPNERPVQPDRECLANPTTTPAENMTPTERNTDSFKIDKTPIYLSA